MTKFLASMLFLASASIMRADLPSTPILDYSMHGEEKMDSSSNRPPTGLDDKHCRGEGPCDESGGMGGQGGGGMGGGNEGPGGSGNSGEGMGSVPEPSTWVLFSLGIGAFMLGSRKHLNLVKGGLN